MVEIVGIRFKKNCKTYFFAPENLKIEKGQYAVVETSRGVELGEVVIGNRQVPEEQVLHPLKPVVRIANDEDLKILEENQLKAKEAIGICKQKVEKHKLNMTLLDAEYTFDRGKILFYFTAEGRIDFRELVKDLAAVFKTRIELRQIGVRDEAKIIKGIGVCGRPFCCSSFLGDFQPVSIKMAKDQNLSLNSTKNSGGCGRLMCCLNFEQETYEEMWKVTPRPKSIIKTPQGEATVLDVNVLKGTLRAVMSATNAVQQFSVDEIKILKNAEASLDEETYKELKKLED
ncbi:MAG: stage 0 sporulation family protein [Clostridia bacterium]|nr:stage 0 sporulation family protein [Clostridia bacterium]